MPSPGIYAYTLTVSNQGESAVERIFVDESGLAGENLLSGGAFTGFTGGDALLNLNGTATILRLEPGQTVTLHYACPLPTNFQAERLQTQCNLSAMYTSGEGNDYLLLALADQPVTLGAACQYADGGTGFGGTPGGESGGGVLEITLERESYDGAMPGHTYENAVTLRNAGTAPLTASTCAWTALAIPGKTPWQAPGWIRPGGPLGRWRAGAAGGRVASA